MSGIKLTGNIKHVLEMLKELTDYMLIVEGSDKVEDMLTLDLNDFFSTIKLTGKYSWREEEQELLINLLTMNN